MITNWRRGAGCQSMNSPRGHSRNEICVAPRPLVHSGFLPRSKDSTCECPSGPVLSRCVFIVISSPAVLETVELRCVVTDDLAPHAGGQVSELALDVLARVGPHAVGMRKIGAPHDLVVAELVQQLDADGIGL